MLKQVGSLMLKLMAMVLTVMFVITLKFVCFAPDIFSPPPQAAPLQTTRGL